MRLYKIGNKHCYFSWTGFKDPSSELNKIRNSSEIKQIIDVFHYIELSCTLEILIEQMSIIEEYSIEQYNKLGNIEENSMFGFKLRVKKHLNNLNCYIKQKLDRTIQGIL